MPSHVKIIVAEQSACPPNGNCMRSKSSSPTDASRPSPISSSRGSSHAPALLPSPPILHVHLLLVRLALPTPPAFLEGLSPPLLAVLLLDPHIMPRTEIHRDRVFEVYSMEHLTSTVDTEIGPFAFKYRNCVPDNHYQGTDIGFAGTCFVVCTLSTTACLKIGL